VEHEYSRKHACQLWYRHKQYDQLAEAPWGQGGRSHRVELKKPEAQTTLISSRWETDKPQARTLRATSIASRRQLKVASLGELTIHSKCANHQEEWEQGRRGCRPFLCTLARQDKDDPKKTVEQDREDDQSKSGIHAISFQGKSEN